MKKIILSLLLTSFCLNGFSKTWTVLSSGMTFSPSTITINQGDSVKFTIDASHNAVEVSQTVWNANGTTSNSGFSIPFGGGTVLPSKLAVGTHYYVCTPHATLGMKGKIVVQAATELLVSKAENAFSVYPNPVANQLNVQLNFAVLTKVELSLFDIQGKLVTLLLPSTPMVGSSTQSFALPGKMVPGVYTIQLQAGSTTSFQKIVVFQ
jgi:plastocyanin